MPSISATRSKQPRQRPRPAVRAFAVIGVDVLADQRDFAHAGRRQPLDFGDDLRHRPRNFRAARVGHDAEGAELVAAFLHGDESGDAARADRRRARRGEMIEFVVDRKFGVDGLAVARGARAAVPAGDDSSAGRTPDRPRAAADDLLALGLRDAAGDRDDDAAAFGGGRFLQAAHAAEFGIDLLGRLLADVAGIEDDEVGVVGGRGLDIALRRQSVRHTTRSRRRSSGSRTI